MQRFSVQRGLALVVRKQPFSAKKAKTVELKTANINLAVDKEFESKTLREVLDLPPHALQGVAEHSNKFYASLSINTISELGIEVALHLVKYSLIEVLHRQVEVLPYCQGYLGACVKGGD